MSNKTEATFHPYTSLREALEAQRAEREEAERQKQVSALTWAIAKRASLG